MSNSVRKFVIESLHGFWERLRQVGVPHADQTASIPFGEVDSTSTSTVFTATVDGITELRDGVCCYIRNDVVNCASGCTLNINGLGAKPMYNSMYDSTPISTYFSSTVTMLFVYNSTRVPGGCWDMYTGYDTNTTYNLNANYISIGHLDVGEYPLATNSLCAFDVNNKLTPFVTTATTSTGKTLVPSTFPVGSKIYGAGYSLSANGVGNNLSTIFSTAASLDLRYSSVNHNMDIFPNYNYYNQIFMPVVVDLQNDTFTLTTQETSGYVNNFTNGRSLVSGNFYIEIGFNSANSTSYSCCLLIENKLYYYNGTKLIEYYEYKNSIGLSGKADKVTGATSGNFAGLDSSGNLTDSGYDYSDFATSGQGVPSGGTTGQVLAKHSNTDNDVEWVNRIDVVQLSSTSGTLTSSQIDAVISDHCIIVWGGDYYYKNNDDGSNVYYICNYVYENSGYINQGEIEISKSTGVYSIFETQSAPATTITFRQW